VELTVSRNYGVAVLAYPTASKLWSTCDTDMQGYLYQIKCYTTIPLRMLQLNQDIMKKKGQLLQKEYINTIIDDLLEVFLHSYSCF
jgi:hypothetical protein